MKLPALLESNPYISTTFTLVSALLGSEKKEEKEKNINEIACILDFTIRMNSDLNVIRYETEFLKKANQSLLTECETLFESYTRTIGYLVPIDKCRHNDDWENLFATLDTFIEELKKAAPQNAMPNINSKNWINLEFSIQKVVTFINNYTAFVKQGNQYYQKFDNIISSYTNEDKCVDQLPYQFNELKLDIKTTIEKFNNTFNLPEIQGSRLKSLLYGETYLK